jgi:hypothetical protein
VLRVNHASSNLASHAQKASAEEAHAAKVLAALEAEVLEIATTADRAQEEGRVVAQEAGLQAAAEIAEVRVRVASGHRVREEEEISIVRAAAVTTVAADPTWASGQGRVLAVAEIARRAHVQLHASSASVHQALSVVAADTHHAHKAAAVDMIVVVEAAASTAEAVAADMPHAHKEIAAATHHARKAAAVGMTVVAEVAAITAEAVGVVTTVADKAVADTIVEAAVDTIAAARVVEAMTGVVRVEAEIARTSGRASKVVIVRTHQDRKVIVRTRHVRKASAMAVMHHAAAETVDQAAHRGIVRSEAQ